MSTAALQLTKKQRKALQFRGKLDKPEKSQEPREEKPKKPKADRKRKAKEAEIAEPESEPKVERKKFERQTNSAGGVVRFIAFVGNLPFKTTAEELRDFLKAANPASVRLMTDKDTGKSRGFAFVDFATSADLKHALKFHHMILGTKKINVELTAGGGGNSDTRKEKLQRRRDDLEKERRKDGGNKRQKTGPREHAEESSGASKSCAPTFSSSEVDKAAKPTATAPTQNAHSAGQDIDDYDDGSSKAKKPNRRKRGRGAHK
ncbi:hypothetical protein GGI04_004341 [Coemansia thaxteri]|nr:hypothetical protein GGI04_004341 [Coemansia thaxteri]KAJ2468022.1 hypothetical protein GGI02_003832 [Coemansia sp. RSA 2322]